jgi:phenol hydroxylase P0 protein
MARAVQAETIERQGELPAALIRIIGLRRDTYVEFQFSLGDEVLTVELILPFVAFAEFCAARQARVLPPSPEIGEAIERLAWRLRRPDLFHLLGYASPRVLGAADAASQSTLQK